MVALCYTRLQCTTPNEFHNVNSSDGAKSKTHHQSTPYDEFEFSSLLILLNIPPISILDTLCGCIWFSLYVFFLIHSLKCGTGSEISKETNTLNKTIRMDEEDRTTQLKLVM